MDQERSRGRKIRAIIFAFTGIVIILCAFQIGIFVGYHKASFSCQWGDRYHQLFGGPRRGFFGDFEGHGFMDAHGMFGIVLKIVGNNVIIKDKDEAEKTVIVGSDVTIQRAAHIVHVGDIAIGEQVVIIGSPNEQGQIEAKFIRLFPKRD